MSVSIKASIDKSAWGPGPWQDEPDRVEFEHLGFPCLIIRQAHSGGLCGYVAVPPGHPWHGVDFAGCASDVEHPDVHGGVTYSRKCCHVPKPGEPDDVWWLGFDHAHCDDLSPRDANDPDSRTRHFETYRDIAYVRQGVESLARQAAEVRA